MTAGAEGPVFHIEPKGRIASQMIQYMVALKLRSLVPGVRISNVDFPEWGIHHPALPLFGRIERAGQLHHFDMDGLAARARAGGTDAVIYNGFGQRLENFLDADSYRAVFRSSIASPYLFDEQYVVCPIRADDSLDDDDGGNHPLTPVEFYADIVAESGLRPVFMGQTAPNLYTDRLRQRFPDALFLEPGNPMLDFEIIRRAKNIALGVTVFGWLAAWLSHAERVFMAVSGWFNPMQCPQVDLLPFGDLRYRFYLFPLNYDVPLAQHEEAHRLIAPYWRFVPQAALQLMFRGAPRLDPFFAEMRQALDLDFYLTMNPDVPTQFGAGNAEAAWDHYRDRGVREGRLPFRFAPAWYAARYPKAALEVAQGDYGNLAHHYAAVGRTHGYRPVPDETKYVAPDPPGPIRLLIRILRDKSLTLDAPDPPAARGSVTLGPSYDRLKTPLPPIAPLQTGPADPFYIYRLRDIILDASTMVLWQGSKPIPATLYLTGPEYELDAAAFLHPEPTDARQHYIVGSNRAYNNYFHWVAQALPAIDWGLRLRRDREVTLALPPLRHPWQQATLALLGYPDVPRLTLDPSRQYLLSSAEYADFLGERMTWTVPATAAVAYARLRQAVPPAEDDGGDAIYIARTDTTRRVMTNEDAVISMLQRQGVRIIVAGQLPLQRQFALFRRARLVIAPHGAGLTNIVACEPGTHVYELLPGAYDNYCYCRLAQACGLHYWCDVFPGEAADDAEPQERSWRADLDDVARTLGNIRARMIALLPTG